jgi:hypothetical protein
VQPPKKKRKRPAKKKPEAKTDEETEGTVRKEVKDFFEKVKEKRKHEELEAKNEGRKERLKAFIDEKETKRRRKLPLKTDYERSVDKSYAKKRQRGSPNSYIEQIPASMSGTATTDKNTKIPVSTSGIAATDKNKEIPASTSGTTTNIEQIPASTTHQTNLFVGTSPKVQKDIDIMSEDKLARLISFYEQTKMPIGGLIGYEDLPADKNQEFRWHFDLGQPLVKPELVNKLPTKMHRFHDWYLKKSAEGLEMFSMLMRPGDFALQNEKVV